MMLKFICVPFIVVNRPFPSFHFSHIYKYAHPHACTHSSVPNTSSTFRMAEDTQKENDKKRTNVMPVESEMNIQKSASAQLFTPSNSICYHVTSPCIAPYSFIFGGGRASVIECVYFTSYNPICYSTPINLKFRHKIERTEQRRETEAR